MLGNDSQPPHNKSGVVNGSYIIMSKNCFDLGLGMKLWFPFLSIALIQPERRQSCYMYPIDVKITYTI